jgi:hypothetical protein
MICWSCGIPGYLDFPRGICPSCAKAIEEQILKGKRPPCGHLEVEPRDAQGASPEKEDRK